MIYSKDNLSGTLFAMKKVDEIVWEGIIPIKKNFSISKILHLPVQQMALVGFPFVREKINIRTRVMIDNVQVLARDRYWEQVTRIDYNILFHAYEDQKPVGVFAADGMKISVDWEHLYALDMEMPCGIVLGIYEMEKAGK